MTHLTLGELIAALDAEDPTMRVPLGFDSPHSYRGYYDQLAFEPARNITVGEMLTAARSALGATYQGWKGGDYTMGEYTDCWLAHRGDTGETIGRTLLRALLAPGRTPLPAAPAPAEPTEPAIEYTITATITTTSQRTLDDARDDFADLIGTNSAYTDVTATSIDVTDSTMPIRLGPYGDAVARAVAEHLDRIQLERAQQIDQLIAVDIATENAAYDAANTAAEQAADGLDDQDGPVVRGELLAEYDSVLAVLRYWARTRDGWWTIRTRFMQGIHWERTDAEPKADSDLTPLGWVEIPPRTQPAPAEETCPPRDPAEGDHVLIRGQIRTLDGDGATVEVYRSNPVGQVVVMQPGALEHDCQHAGADVPAPAEETSADV